jgi:hypothetical protein
MSPTTKSPLRHWRDCPRGPDHSCRTASTGSATARSPVPFEPTTSRALVICDAPERAPAEADRGTKDRDTEGPSPVPLPSLRRPDDHRRNLRRPAPCAIAIPKSDQDRHLMTVAPHPISQSRSLSLPAARRTRTAMSSQASAEPLHASTRAQAAHLHDRTSSPSSFRSTQSSPRRFRTDPGAPSATRKSHRSRPLEPFRPAVSSRRRALRRFFRADFR